MTLSSDSTNSSSTQTDGSQSSLPQVTTETPRLPQGRARNQIIDSLKGDNYPTGFLPAAESMLLAVSDEFIGMLGVESVRTARARNATAVDRQDVQEADRRLRGTRGAERRTWLLGLGGLLGGAAASAVVALVISPTPVRHASDWWLAIAVLGVLAVVLIGFSYPPGKRQV